MSRTGPGVGRAFACALASLAAAAPAAGAAERPLGATIRTTTYGIPHVQASDWAGLGFGLGYAHAQDNICTLAETYTTVAAQRSRYFGPDRSWTFRGNGSTVNNRNSDFFYQRINDSKIVEKQAAEPPPRGPVPQLHDSIRGYVAGYNKRLADWGGAAGVPDQRCRGKEWVRPITELDAHRRFYQLASLASQGVAIDGIGAAAPLLSLPTSASAQRDQLAQLEQRLKLPIGSNAYGFGKELTDNGRGMVLGNPHFPWDGSERLWQAHATIPGKVDVAGAGLLGVPLALIGHTRGLAWSHTVATAFRFTPYQLALVPGSPTKYVLDGQVRDMQADRVTIELADGKKETRTLYSSVHGPIFTSILGLPLFPWSGVTAYAMADANATNFRYLNHFFETNQAQSVREYHAIQNRYQGIPWVNSIAADAAGEAYYSMNGAIPNVSNAKRDQCNVAGLGTVAVGLLGLPVLDGSRSACNWDTDPGAAAPGIFGPDKVPFMFRDDFVHNGNDSHWLTNPKQPLEGYAAIIGNERTQRSLRTRLGLKMVEDRAAGRDGHPGTKFSLDTLTKVTLDNRQYAGELWRDALVAMCRANPTLLGSAGPVDVSAACDVLARWDRRDDLDSRGAILFRRFVNRALASPLPAGPNPVAPFTTPFSAADPVNTPNGLNTGSPLVGRALADAVSDLRGANIPLDAPLRDFQYEERGGQKIPIHGGPGTVGLFNAINVSWDAKRGYPNVPHGSSYIMAAQFTGDRGCPVRTRTFTTYGQTEDQGSPHASDFTRAFSEKRWLDERFCQPDVIKDPELSILDIGDRCTPRSAFLSVRVRHGGARDRIRFITRRRAGGPGRVLIDVRRAAGGSQLVRLDGGGTITWRRRLRDGDYLARISARGPEGLEDVRQIAFTVRRGRVVASAPASMPSSCGLIAEYSAPAGFGSRSLVAAFRLRYAARVRLELQQRSGRIVARTAERSFTGDRAPHTLRLPARGRRPGRYRLRLVARPAAGGRSVRAALWTRRIH